MGYNNTWFAAHLAALVLTYFTGGTKTGNWRRRRRERQ